MAKQRLSKLQKTILMVLNEKDLEEKKSVDKGMFVNWPWCFKKSKEPPYFHRIRPTYCTSSEPFVGIPFGFIVEPGVKRMVSEVTDKSKELTKVFDVSFSRALSNMETKGLIETFKTKSRAINHQIYGAALTSVGKEALKLISSVGKVNNNKHD